MQWRNKKYKDILKAAEADSKLRSLEHKYLWANTYKRFFSIIFCEKPVMLRFKIKKVKTPQETQNPNVEQSDMDITKNDNPGAGRINTRSKLAQWEKRWSICVRTYFVNNEMHPLTFWMSVSTILYWSGMCVTMCVMLSSDVLTSVGPNTIARFLGSI